MNKKKVVVVEEKEKVKMPVIMTSPPNMPVVAPSVSDSRGVQKPHFRRYRDHITIINRTGGVQRVIKPITLRPTRVSVISPIRLPEKAKTQEAIITGVKEEEDEDLKMKFDDMISFLISFFADHKMWIGATINNRDEWMRYYSKTFMPTFKVFKEHWERYKDRFKTLPDLQMFYNMVAKFIAETDIAALRIENMKLSLLEQERISRKLRDYWVSEWGVDYGQVANYFVELFKDYWNGKISKSQLNNAVGGSLDEIQKFIGEKL